MIPTLLLRAALGLFRAGPSFSRSIPVRTLLLTFTIFALPIAALGQASPSHYTILPVSQGPVLLHQCSRGSPTNVTAFWTPSAAQIIAIERRLPDLLRQAGHAIKLSESCRQYLGVISGGKRLIYVNAFPASLLRVLDHADWKTAAFIVCDGGDEFWGAEFDPATNSFRNIEFNGVAQRSSNKTIELAVSPLYDLVFRDV